MTQCTARNKQGEPCKQPAINGTSKCHYHGGASLVGIAHPNFKTGRYSKHLPTRLAARYAEALSDPQLMELRDEIALVGTRQGELMTYLDSGLSLQHWRDAQAAHSEMLAAIRDKDGHAMQMALAALGNALAAGMGDYDTWREIVELTEQRRKLVDSEQKRLAVAQQMLSVEQAMALAARLVESVRKHVSDPFTLAAIAAELTGIINKGDGQGTEQ